MHVQCQCGARLRLPDQAISKRVRCPKCGAVVAEPAGVGATETPFAPSFDGPSLRGNDDTVKVRCACGASLRLPASAAGRRARCPKCREPVQVPAAINETIDDLFSGLSQGETVELERPAAPAPTPRRVDDDGLIGIAPVDLPPPPPREYIAAPGGPPKPVHSAGNRCRQTRRSAWIAESI